MQKRKPDADQFVGLAVLLMVPMACVLVILTIVLTLIIWLSLLTV